MKIKELRKILKDYNQNHEVFFLDESTEKPKASNITKVGTIEGIEAVILGHGECPNCKGEKTWQN